MLRTHRIAHRDERPQRIFLGLSLGELILLGATCGALWSASLVFHLGFWGTAVLSVVAVAGILFVSRRFRPGEVADWIAFHADVLLVGGRAYQPILPDTARRGADGRFGGHR